MQGSGPSVSSSMLPLTGPNDVQRGLRNKIFAIWLCASLQKVVDDLSGRDLADFTSYWARVQAVQSDYGVRDTALVMDLASAWSQC